MSHLLKYTEWEQNGKWYSGDISDLAHGSNFWWLPARMLEMELTDYVLLLKDKFHAQNFRYLSEPNLLLFDWKNYSDCHKFTLYINNEARKRKFFI